MRYTLLLAALIVCARGPGFAQDVSGDDMGLVPLVDCERNPKDCETPQGAQTTAPAMAAPIAQGTRRTSTYHCLFEPWQPEGCTKIGASLQYMCGPGVSISGCARDTLAEVDTFVCKADIVVGGTCFYVGDIGDGSSEILVECAKGLGFKDTDSECRRRDTITAQASPAPAAPPVVAAPASSDPAPAFDPSSVPDLPALTDEQRERMRKSVHWYPDRAAPGTTEKDLKTCSRGYKIEAMTACTTLIESKAYAGRELAAIYAWRGYSLAGLGRFDLAVKDTEEAQRIDPESSVAEGSHELSARWMQNVALFEAATDVALKRNPHDAKALSYRATWRQMQGDIEGALADVTQMIAIEPGKASHYHLRGELQWKLGRNPEAIADCTKALELDPAELAPYITRGLAAIKTAQSALDMNTASEDIDKGLASQTDKATRIAILDLRGIGWYGFEAPDRAINDYRSILRLDPGNTTALDMLKRIGGLSSLDDESERCNSDADMNARNAACTTLIGRLQRHELAAALLKRARTFTMVGGPDAYQNALKDADRALELAPDITDLLYLHAVLSVQVGDYAAAKRDYGKLVTLVPKSRMAHDVGMMLAGR